MSQFKVEKNGNPYSYIDAVDYSDAMEIILGKEGFKITLEKEQEYSLYYQRAKRNEGIKIGKSGLSFQNYGCFIHCLAFLAKQDPIDVLKKLVDGGAITNTGLVISQKAADILDLELLKGDDKYIPGKMNDINYMPSFTSIKEVTLGKSQHFVVRIVDAEGKRSIYDPWTNKILPVNYYNFRSYRLFKAK